MCWKIKSARLNICSTSVYYFVLVPFVQYYQDNESGKKLFLKKCSEDIQSKDPYIYLSDNIYPRHNDIQIYNGREKRLERVWAFPVPTPENNNVENLENLEGTEVQEDSQNEIQNEIQGLNQPNSTIDV